MTECQVCQKHKTLENLPGGPIYEDEQVFIAHFPHLPNQRMPHYGHLIIEMKRHLITPSQLDVEESSAVGIWMQKLTQILETKLSAEHVYFFRIGDQTKHLHFHLVPRFAGTPKEDWGIALYQNPRGKKASESDAAQISDLIRGQIR